MPAGRIREDVGTMTGVSSEEVIKSAVKNVKKLSHLRWDAGNALGQARNVISLQASGFAFYDLFICEGYHWM
jgi:outer membrane protease